MPSRHSPLVVIVGPTAVGKTEVAVRVAEAVGGEVISADSRLFYRGMDIGTAKPSAEERTRVPPHLIDEPWSLAGCQSAAAEMIRQVQERGRLPMLVGGTGQYIRAVVEGWQPPAHAANPRLRAALERWGQEIGPHELHRRLAVIDPLAAKVVDAPNLRRTVRALEGIFSSGERVGGRGARSAGQGLFT